VEQQVAVACREIKRKAMDNRILKSRRVFICSRSLNRWIWTGLLLAAIGIDLGSLYGQSPANTVPPTTQGGQIENTRSQDAKLPSDTEAQLYKLNNALKAAQAAGDVKSEVQNLLQIYKLHNDSSQFAAALEDLNKVVVICRQAHDQNAEATILNYISKIDESLGKFQDALDSYKQELTIYRQIGNSIGEGSTLLGIADVYYAIGRPEIALDYYSLALPNIREVKDSNAEVVTLGNIANCYEALGRWREALDTSNLALPISRSMGDRNGEGRMLLQIGASYNKLGQKQSALDFLNQALSVFQELGNRESLAEAQLNIGLVYFNLGEKKKALDFYDQALPVLRESNDQNLVVALINTGKIYADFGREQKALDLYNQALSLIRGAADNRGTVYRGMEASTLDFIGMLYSHLGDKQKALDFLEQAQQLNKSVGDLPREAEVLNNIGLVYADLGKMEKALDCYYKALAILGQVGDRRVEATVQDNLGMAYKSLGDQHGALDHCNQSLSIVRDIGDRELEAISLNNLAAIYSSLGDKQKALDFDNQALMIHRSTGSRSLEATALNNIGTNYKDLGQNEKALEYLNQALQVQQDLGNLLGQAVTLNNIGEVYSNLGLAGKQKALDFFNRALPLAKADNSPIEVATIFFNLAANEASSQPTLAIFYGKQAVNILQQVRKNIQGLGEELQAGFLASKNSYYRNLADLLIDKGRLPEAQQVLDLLKQQEYVDYVRGDPPKMLGLLTLTPAEKQADEDYQKSTGQLVSLGAKFADLKKISSRTSEEEKQYQELADQMSAASNGLNGFYARLYALLGRDSDANKQVAVIKVDVSKLNRAIAKAPHTVGLYTLVGKERTSIIVITGTATVAREFPISDKELNKKIFDFKRVLRNPAKDPKPLAQDLYKILIGPIKSDLEQAGAETLVWSLDGVLRYVPMAALYDGKQYLAENYNMVTFTPASSDNLDKMPDVSDLSAAAMGISHKYEDGLPELPSVPNELRAIVKDPQALDARGVLPGTVLLNDQFTVAAMEKQLDGKHSVVHIASHFIFKPGNDTQSYLLLAGKDKDAGGFHLTVAEFRDDLKLALDDTDLLTLSACDTGMEGDASDGREVDGLGMTAQLKGAKAVISSLWEVNDTSTGELMADFYKRWANGGGKVEKVEAIRQAQLDLLDGRVAPKPDSMKPNAPTSFSHPYYWAPFVLMGNWR
jgi:CHAT domain-containing protein/tetratricopeptide (TPR) repeat protein